MISNERKEIKRFPPVTFPGGIFKKRRIFMDFSLLPVCPTDFFLRTLSGVLFLKAKINRSVYIKSFQTGPILRNNWRLFLFVDPCFLEKTFDSLIPAFRNQLGYIQRLAVTVFPYPFLPDLYYHGRKNHHNSRYGRCHNEGILCVKAFG